MIDSNSMVDIFQCIVTNTIISRLLGILLSGILILGFIVILYVLLVYCVLIKLKFFRELLKEFGLPIPIEYR